MLQRHASLLRHERLAAPQRARPKVLRTRARHNLRSGALRSGPCWRVPSERWMHHRHVNGADRMRGFAHPRGGCLKVLWTDLRLPYKLGGPTPIPEPSGTGLAGLVGGC
jgi:hypothetical protein